MGVADAEEGAGGEDVAGVATEDGRGEGEGEEGGVGVDAGDGGEDGGVGVGQDPRVGEGAEGGGVGTGEEGGGGEVEEGSGGRWGVCWYSWGGAAAGEEGGCGGEGGARAQDGGRHCGKSPVLTRKGASTSSVRTVRPFMARRAFCSTTWTRAL